MGSISMNDEIWDATVTRVLQYIEDRGDDGGWEAKREQLGDPKMTGHVDLTWFYCREQIGSEWFVFSRFYPTVRLAEMEYHELNEVGEILRRERSAAFGQIGTVQKITMERVEP